MSAADVSKLIHSLTYRSQRRVRKRTQTRNSFSRTSPQLRSVRLITAPPSRQINLNLLA